MTHEWREHPQLKALWHPDHPDDLQVLIHDGGPRLTDKLPELVWVTITGMQKSIFIGRVLDKPISLQNVRQNDEILIIIPKQGSNYPILVTEKYLDERADWIIYPCQQCGLSELFDAPSDLIKAINPNAPEGSFFEAFTSICPLCGGPQTVQHRDAKLDEPPEKKGRWWKFWRRNSV